MAGLFGALFGAPAMGPFKKKLRCYSVAHKNSEMEYGDKILLPQSNLHDLVARQVQYPMMFSITGPVGLKTHCSVMEFTAEEGRCYLPHWMMDQLGTEEGALVDVENVSLVQGTFCKIQPHSKAFLEISNHRAVLEKALRSYSCLSEGGLICFKYADKVYRLNVLATKPARVVSIIETNMDVDFAPPLDYVEPTKRDEPDESKAKGSEMTFATPDGEGEEDAKTADATADATAAGGGAAGKEEPGFVAFSGRGYRLDGKDTDNSGSAGGARSALAAAAEARRARQSAAGGTILSGGRVLTTPRSAGRRRSVNRFESQRRAAAFKSPGHSLK